MIFRITQDGRDFYNEDNGDLVFSAPKIVRDTDHIAARAARASFVRYWKREYYGNGLFIVGEGLVYDPAGEGAK